jgi:hypothetical protein
MNHDILNEYLERNSIEKNIKNILDDFELSKSNITIKRGIYIIGSPGSGKTSFINNVLKKLNYDIVYYNSCDVRNKSVIETVNNYNMSDQNVINLMKRKPKKIVLVMDEIDGMNNGDKGGINGLIKIIRPKKTKKQKLEHYSMIPIICIGNKYMDKKLKELQKVCHSFELPNPTSIQLTKLATFLMPKLTNISKYVDCVQSDLRKLNNMYKLYLNNVDLLKDNFEHFFTEKSYNEDVKEVTKELFLNKNILLNDHCGIISETDRTIIALLYHENVVNYIDKYDKNKSIPFYINILENICFADYIDRVTFQKQIWQFNEMSSLIKTMKSNYDFHNFIKDDKIKKNEIRFTKVLTKYSTEYNNMMFIMKLCQQLQIDKKDLFVLFNYLKSLNISEEELCELFENYDICKLDIKRIIRYVDNYTEEYNINKENVEILE